MFDRALDENQFSSGTISKVRDKNRSVYWWLIVLIAIVLVIPASVFVPYLVRQRLARRIEAAGGALLYVEETEWPAALEQIPGLEMVNRRPVHLCFPRPYSRDVRSRLPLLSNLSRRDSSEHLAVLKIAANLPSIEILDLADTFIEDDDLKVLSSWPLLRNLDLSNSHVTNRCLHQISKASRLRVLVLCNCEIGDTALKEMVKLPLLEELDLTGTKITDVGLGYLKSLKQLRVLGLSNTQVSESAVNDLVKALPNLEVTDD